MSKYYQNSILLSEEEDTLAEKISNSVTDRPKLTDQGNPDRCPIGNLHQIFSEPERLNYITHGCTTASIRCIDCKALSFESVNRHLRPIREERRKWAQNLGALREIVCQGAARASETAEETMKWVRQSIGLLNSSTLKRYDPSLINSYPSHRDNVRTRNSIELIINGSSKGHVPTLHETIEQFALRQAKEYGLSSFSVL